MRGVELLRRAARKAQRVLGRLIRAEGASAQRLEEFLGFTANEAYAAQREEQRQRYIASLSGCSPAGSRAQEMAGYLDESALRFHDTIALIQEKLPSPVRGRLLEIGSNPYFLTILLRAHWPELGLLGVNYFGPGSCPPGSTQSQEVVDPQGRYKLAEFIHADVEQHALDGIGVFDVTLFCEVIEHLPFDPAWALHNVARTLKNDGLLIVTTPNPSRVENIRRLVSNEGTTNDPISGYGIHGRHNREYTAAELHDMLSGTGLHVEQHKTIDVHPNAYSESAERSGHGAYHIFVARRVGELALYRPAWLYRSFGEDRLSSMTSIAAPGLT